MAILGPFFDQNPSFLQGFIRGLLQKGVNGGPAQAALGPGRTSTPAQAWPAGGRRIFFDFFPI